MTLPDDKAPTSLIEQVSCSSSTSESGEASPPLHSLGNMTLSVRPLASREFLHTAPTKQDVERLVQLGLSTGDFSFFVDRFVGHGYEFNVLTADEWRVERNVPLTPRLLIAHLAGDLWVGTGARWNSVRKVHTTEYFAVDLDFDGNETS